MSKYRRLLKNMSVITIGQFSSKFLVFLLVPLYTNYLSTSEYGVYDLVTAIISLLIPVLTLNINSSTQRFSMDENADLDSILSYSLKCIIASIFVFIFFLIANYILGFSEILKDYIIPTVILFSIECLVSILTSFAIGIDRVAIVSISGAIATLSMLISNILFLVVFKMGLIGFFIANIIGPTTQCIIISIKLRIWKYCFKKKNTLLFKEMLSFSTPLIANNIAWWVNNVSDRFVITFFLGVSVNGIYSIGYKIPSVLNVFQTIFSQAWAISSVRSFDAKDKDGFFSKVYSFYSFLMVEICSILILFTKLIAKIMYAKDFFNAWEYVPFLLISVLFGSLSGFLGGIFSASKESKIYAKSTVAGAVCNFILNIILVQIIGAIGAAIATAFSYILIWSIRLFNSRQYIRMKIHYLKDFTAYFIIILQAIMFIFIKHTILLYTVQLLLFIFLNCVYYQDINKSFVIIQNYFRKNNNIFLKENRNVKR